jgi:hypothetical protein
LQVILDTRDRLVALDLDASIEHELDQDASLILDGDAIQAAASRAQPFWPESAASPLPLTPPTAN